MKRREVGSRAPMTAAEVALTRALAKCGLKTGSADKRFCEELSAITKREQRVRITEGQRAYLWRIGYRYRLQLPPEIFGILQARHPVLSLWLPQASGQEAALELTEAGPPSALDMVAETRCT